MGRTSAAHRGQRVTNLIVALMAKDQEENEWWFRMRDYETNQEALVRIK